LAQLADCPKLRAEMGMAAVTRVQEKFSWPNKGEWMAEVYRSVLSGPSAPQIQYGGHARLVSDNGVGSGWIDNAVSHDS
jgi:hypothetical protein